VHPDGREHAAKPTSKAQPTAYRTR